MKMNILWCADYFQPDYYYLVHYLCKEQKAIGNETYIISSNKISENWKPSFKNIDNFKSGEYTYKTYSLLRLSTIGFFSKPFPIYYRQILNIFKNKQYSVVHFVGIASFFNLYLMTVCLLSRNKAPFIMSDHSNPATVNTSVLGKIYYKLISLVFQLYKRRISKYIVPNLGSMELIQKRYGIARKQIKIIPLGYDRDIYKWEPQEKNNCKEFIIGFAGKVEPRKKIERIFYAVNEIKNSAIKIIIVGGRNDDKYTNYLKSEARKMKLNVEFKPLIDDPHRLCSFYNFIDVAVFPGSISITTIEASACGTPIILYKSIKGLEDRVDNGRGKLFTTTDELQSYIKDYMAIGINNEKINLMTQKYAWNKIVQQYIIEYNEAIKED